jgi:hypothetical protein
MQPLRAVKDSTCKAEMIEDEEGQREDNVENNCHQHWESANPMSAELVRKPGVNTLTRQAGHLSGDRNN